MIRRQLGKLPKIQRLAVAELVVKDRAGVTRRHDLRGIGKQRRIWIFAGPRQSKKASKRARLADLLLRFGEAPRVKLQHLRNHVSHVRSGIDAMTDIDDSL